MALSQHVKNLAASSVSQNETMRKIRLASVNTIDTPMPTPDALRVGGCALLDYLWKSYAAPEAEAGRERDDGR